MVNILKQLFKHQDFKKYFTNTSWLFAEKILRMIVGLFIGIWIARYLGPNKFGLLSYAQSIIGLFSAIVMLGLNGIVVKELVQFPEKENEILWTSFIMKLISALVSIFLIFIILQFIDSSSANILIYIISLSWIFQSFNVIDFYFQSKVMSKYVVFANMISLLFSSIVKIFLILNNVSLIYFAFVIVFDNIILALGYIYFYLKLKHKILVRELVFSFKLAKDLIKQSWPLILSGMSFVVYNNIDKIMIQNMLSSYEVGIYSAAVRLSNFWQFIPGLIVSSLMPFMVKGYEISKKEFFKRLKLIAAILIWISLIIALIYTNFSEIIIKYTFGSKYIDSIDIMVILIWSNIFIFFNTVWNRWKMIEHKTKITFYFSLSVSILNIILNLFLIEIYGVIGAAYALLLSLFISYIIFYILLDRKVILLFIESIFLKGVNYKS